MSVATEPVMRARGINKVFGATHALRGVDFDVVPGQVTALFGENGAGKSTLMKILAGIEAPTTGTLELDGQPVEINGPRDAADRGIAIIQELSLFPNLSIADNVFMARERIRSRVMVDQQRQREITAKLMERLDEPLDSETPVGDLRVGQQQIVEIARALAQEARVLIMDEPTSALSVAEVDVLFRVIRELTAGGVAIVYISHHLEEALEIADRRRLPRRIARRRGRGRRRHDLGHREDGRAQPGRALPPRARPGPRGPAPGRGARRRRPGRPGRRLVDDVTLTVRAGEIVGLYGLMGAGRHTELLETLAGRVAAADGRVLIDRRPFERTSIPERLDLGLALVPEDRQRDGLVQPMSVGQNMTLASLWQYVRGAWVSGDRESAAIARMMKTVSVKASGPQAPIGSLSGGNQQKVVLCKALLTDPRVCCCSTSRPAASTSAPRPRSSS